MSFNRDRDNIFLQEENVLDSPDAKNIASKTPRVFEVKEKENINSVIKEIPNQNNMTGQNKITIGKEHVIKEADEATMQKIDLKKNPTKCNVRL